jgi:CDP-glycerol glycerophosphotransferase (TagB/SpsB family)
MLNAGIVLSTTPGLDVYQWKRSKETAWYVHILHAAGDAIGYRMFGIDHYDAILLSGQYQIKQIRHLEELRGLPAKELQIVGLTYFDTMYQRLKSDSNSQALIIDKAKKDSEHKLTVLLAPSWGQSSILCRYGEKIISELLNTGYYIIIRPHPQSMISERKIIESLQSRFPESERLSWNFDNDNFNVLKESDIMISDFSGVIFDYTLIFDRPVIFADTDFDKAPYDAAWFEGDKPLWTFKILRSIGVPLKESEFSSLKNIIDEAISDPRLAEGRKRAREDTWMYPGESTTRIVEYLEQKQKNLRLTEKSAE